MRISWVFGRGKQAGLKNDVMRFGWNFQRGVLGGWVGHGLGGKMGPIAFFSYDTLRCGASHDSGATRLFCFRIAGR